MTQYEVVYVVHKFIAENKDEIALEVGEPVVVLEKDEKYHDGWWKGRSCHGNTGLFPVSYTTPNKPIVPSTTFSIAASRHSVTSHQSTRINKGRPDAWDVGQVAGWLKSMGMEAAAELFQEQEITGDILLELTVDSLKELGISTYGKRHKVMTAINKLKKGETPQENHYEQTAASRGPIPKTSLSAGSILQPTRTRSQRVGSQEIRPSSPGADTLYQFPRKAPLPPLAGSMQDYASHPLSFSYDPITITPLPPLPSLPFTTTATTTTTAHPYATSVAGLDLSMSDLPSVDAFKTPEHEGWLYKKSDRYKTWNKRWFILKDSNLFYFKSLKDVRMKGIINLRGYRIIVDATIHTGNYSFKAQHERERTFFFYTDSQESMRIWTRMLIKATITRDLTVPVLSSNHMATVPLEVARQMRPRPPSAIMYKSKPKSEAKMEMLQEEEEGLLHLHHQPSVEEGPAPHYRQTRESGITVYPHLLGDTEEEVPQLPTTYFPLTERTPSSPHLHSGAQQEEQDSVDPHYPSTIGDRRNYLLSPPQQTGPPSEPPIELQTKAQYIAWVNQHLPAGQHVVELISAFRNGNALVQLLESISGKVVQRPALQQGGSASMQMLDTIVAAFKFMGREGVVVDGRYTIKDVFSGNEEKIMEMMDAIHLWSEQVVVKRRSNERANTPEPPALNKLKERLEMADRAEQVLRQSMFEEEDQESVSFLRH
ncbi:hypothetical protein BDF14DRAFT_1716364 [Spinellus fusiger]|nr:hypothetical protein BDF14DRAFT_1716364 [Spinellus fusiger]